MNLYEFTFIAQQSLLQQEVEGIIQELAVLLKNIKAEAIFQEAKHLIGKGNDNSAKQKLEACAKAIQEMLIVYSDALGDVVKVLWTELEEDLSNLKEIKVKIDHELKDVLKDFGITQKLSETGLTKSALINNTVAVLKKSISEHMLKSFQSIAESFDDDTTRLVKILEKLSKNIEASGLIKYEHWGLLDFAYPINKMKSGHYCILCISSTPSIMDEFVRKVKLNENLIRYLSVQVDKVFEGKSYMMNRQVEE
ncbi:MAG: 30S ribosomal protein S6 [Wolbachia endosymbiont of Tyrophagus putrescentiae]|nr:30S ribosomal protein S6 [Wolbachia endosymbiont of Tyrophagus putrescentiae]